MASVAVPETKLRPSTITCVSLGEVRPMPTESVPARSSLTWAVKVTFWSEAVVSTSSGSIERPRSWGGWVSSTVSAVAAKGVNTVTARRNRETATNRLPFINPLPFNRESAAPTREDYRYVGDMSLGAHVGRATTGRGAKLWIKPQVNRGGPVSRAGSTSLGPHVAPGIAPGAFLRPVVCIAGQTKTLLLQGFRPIAGAGFEPATFGL